MPENGLSPYESLSDHERAILIRERESSDRELVGGGVDQVARAKQEMEDELEDRTYLVQDEKTPVGITRERPLFKELAPEEERDLIRRYQEDPSKVGQEILNQYGRLVDHIARKITSDRIILDDLCQVGEIVLLEVTKNFDLDSGNKVATYVYSYIRGAMLHEITQINDVKPYDFELLTAIAREKTRLRELYGRNPNDAKQLNNLDELVMNELGITVSDYRELEGLRTIFSHLTLDDLAQMELDAEKEPPTLSDEIEDIELGNERGQEGLIRPLNEPRLSFYEETDKVLASPVDQKAETPNKIISRIGALDILTPKERQVIELRFGVGSEAGVHTIQDTADIINSREVLPKTLSREGVRRVEARALARMRIAAIYQN